MDAYAGLSIGQVSRRKPLTQCGIEELASHARSANAFDGGVAFARKQMTEQKDLARAQVLSLFAALPEAWILTMPGLMWGFERALLALREGADWADHARGPERTRISAVENDRVIYHGAITQMPGMESHRRSKVRVLGANEWAERRVANDWVCRYYFGNVADLMRSRSGKSPYQAAWLDFTGPLSIARVADIRAFFRRHVERVAVVTALKARWNRETADVISGCGGYEKWLRKSFVGFRVLHYIEYQDGPSPMAQIALKAAS